MQDQNKIGEPTGPNQQVPTTNTNDNNTNTINSSLRDLSPSFHQTDRIRYPSQDGTYFSRFSREPLVTTLTGFSHVANLVRNPYELINNVDEFVKQASGNRRKHPRPGDSLPRTVDQYREIFSPATNVTVQELDTFTASSQNFPRANTTNDQSLDSLSRNILHHNQKPIPALPIIECEKKYLRLEPLTIEEYETKFRLKATDLELIDRVFLGGMANNQLRAAIWPYLFGLVKHRGRFEQIHSPVGGEAHLFVEHEANSGRWQELQRLYHIYQAQWKAILPDQELRFSTFRERKSLIERDVIRCDRLHPFYADEPQNLSSLTNLLMTYMMYDFDIGYVQGMSDLAGPILFMYRGDVVKSFWILVEVMKLFRRNFELTQKTIHFQLSCLYQLVKATDPIFAQYLEENESSNCFFAFRAIVCLFKRELMKEEEDDYTKVLDLWDTIWCVHRRCTIGDELKALNRDDMQVDFNGITDGASTSDLKEPRCKPTTEQPTDFNQETFIYQYEPNQSDTPRRVLTETEIFVLALCLSMIRRERDLVLANRLDGTDIHLHFMNPKLATDLNGFIQHAINIYSYIKSDLDITKLTSPKEESATRDANPESPPGSAEGYDLLNDFLIINGSSGS